ncbi:uncharacterized protein V6R79_011509 [Siganus canaliculatus]
MCNFLRDNDEQMPKEIHVHPTVAMCSSLRDNTDEMPIEIHVQPTYVAMCSSLRGNLDQSLCSLLSVHHLTTPQSAPSTVASYDMLTLTAAMMMMMQHDQGRFSATVPNNLTWKLEMPIEIHVQPTYVAMCSSLRDNTDEPSFQSYELHHLHFNPVSFSDEMSNWQRSATLLLVPNAAEIIGFS